MLSILCVRLTMKVKVRITESFKVGWCPPKKTGSSHLNWPCDVVTCDVDWCFNCILPHVDSLFHVMRSTGSASPVRHSAPLWLVGFQLNVSWHFLIQIHVWLQQSEYFWQNLEFFLSIHWICSKDTAMFLIYLCLVSWNQKLRREIKNEMIPMLLINYRHSSFVKRGEPTMFFFVCFYQGHSDETNSG